MTRHWWIVGLLLLAPAAAAQAQDGQTLYGLNCKKCHGIRGVPPKTIAKKMDKIVTFDSTFVAKVSVDSIVKVLTRGGESEDMKSFKDKLTPAQMLLVARYVHELGGRKSGGTPD